MVKGQELSADSSLIRFNSGLSEYVSYSQVKRSFPMNMGYPLLYTRTASLGVEYMRQGKKAGHLFNAEIFVPVALNSDNGTGSDFLLHKEGSYWFRSGAGYRMSMSLMRTGDFRIYHGIATGMLFERRKLNYQSNASEITSDLNIYLGPSLQAVFTVTDDWQLSGGFDALFYLPYLNYGKISKRDMSGSEFYSTAYHGFYYQTEFSFSVRYRRLMLSLIKNDMAGYSSQQYGFDKEGMVHFKLDRICSVKLSLEL